MHSLIDQYTDFLISCPGQCSATMMSDVTNGLISHDQITRLLASQKIDSRALWKMVKPMCHEVSSDEAVLIIDDCIQPKPHSRVNGLVSYHFDHTINRAVKGINIVSALFHSRDVSIPVGVEFVNKDIEYTDKEGKVKRKASVNRNEQFRNLVMHGANNLRFRYVLCDTWYATVENMRFIVDQAQTNFVMAVKDNRRVALSLADKRAGRYRPITETAPEGFACIVWLEKLDFPVLITKQVFNNGDGSCGILYLASSDLGLDAQRMATIYQQRWKVEQYHKSLKQISGLGQSPSWKIHTQRSHLCASVMAYVKLELYKERHGKNHFAIRAMMLKNAARAAWQVLNELAGKKAA